MIVGVIFSIDIILCLITLLQILLNDLV